MWKAQIFTLLVFAQVALQAQTKHPEAYVCYQANKAIEVDGDLTSPEWGKAEWTNYFVDIEGDKKPKPTYNTRVKMLWDDQYFYFAAELEEPHIWAKLTERDAVIFYDNDFEIFIDPQGDNHLYYEFEMNALNTVWDLLLVKPYRDGAPAIDSWDMQGLKTATKVYGTLNNPADLDKKWTLEVAIPWKVLEEAAWHNGSPKDGEQWRVNFSRVNWDITTENGKYEKQLNPKTGTPLPEHNWVWSPQTAIAMHQPETWGIVQFSTQKAGDSPVAFQTDLDYQLKNKLVALYQKQKDYKSKNGKYAKKASQLGADNSKFTLENTSKQFLIYAKAPTGRTWFINQLSRLWSE